MATNFTEYKDVLIPGDDGYLPHEKTKNQCTSTHKSYGCTRTWGHTGPHAAHGSRGQQYATWED